MPPSVWEKSTFLDGVEKTGEANVGPRLDSNANQNCHASAANMYGVEEQDFRLMMCAQVNDANLITVSHEIGHIMYFMAYRDLPTILQVRIVIT